MAGIVYLRTNRFEVKLEGITFKAKDFETLCTLDFLFPDGKIWARPPIVGLDVMRHPRDPAVILLLLGIGVGCVILRFRAGGSLPDPIHRFLTDQRIRFVGFGIQEKRDIFPFEELGLTKNKVDVCYLAAKHLNNPKYKRLELGQLACKVLGIKRMIGLADASSFERHEQIKCAICQLFITNVIAMALLDPEDKKSAKDSPKESSFLKSLNSLPSFTERWFKLPRVKKDNNNKSPTAEKGGERRLTVRLRQDSAVDDIDVKTNCGDDTLLTDQSVYVHDIEDSCGDDLSRGKSIAGFSADGLDHQGKTCVEVKKDDDSLHTKPKETSPSRDGAANKDPASPTKAPIKGILKSPSSRLDSPPQANKELCTARGGSLRRANSKGCNVSFKCH